MLDQEDSEPADAGDIKMKPLDKDNAAADGETTVDSADDADAQNNGKAQSTPDISPV